MATCSTMSTDHIPIYSYVTTMYVLVQGYIIMAYHHEEFVFVPFMGLLKVLSIFENPLYTCTEIQLNSSSHWGQSSLKIHGSLLQ